MHQSAQEWLNFGVSGYGTDQEYLRYQQEGAAFDVDAVALLFTAYDDIGNNRSSRAYEHAKPYFTLDAGALQVHRDHVRKPRISPLINQLRVRSHVINIMEKGGRGISNGVQQWLYERFGFGFTRARPVLLDDTAVSSWDEGIRLIAVHTRYIH